MRTCLVCLLLLLPAVSRAATPVSVLPGDPLSVFTYSGPTSGTPSGRAEVVDADGMPFARAWRLTTISLPDKPEASVEWSMRIRVRGALAVAKDDVALAKFWIRCVAPQGGECSTRLNIERNGSPYTKSISQPALSTADWHEVKMPFRWAEDYAPGGYYIDFWMGQQVQTVEVGGITVENYGRGATNADMGLDAMYEGSSPDAAWRAAAAERIDRLRKANLAVVVLDAAGLPVAGAEVHMKMTRHAFGFGTAVAASRLLGDGPDNDRYRAAILANFNMVVLENDLKWPNWESNRQRALDAIAWFRDHGISRIRGHNLIWPSWQYLPSGVQALASTPDMLRQRILAHIDDEVSATRGQLEDWDVINEPYTNHQVMDVLGDAEMAAWFQRARSNDGDALLFVNDYSILSAGGADLAHRNAYYNTIAYLDSLGAPVGGIGMQGHFASPTPPETMLRILDRFAVFGKAIEVTEFDFATTDEQMQAQFTRDLLTVVFSHPSIKAFLMWGFWEGSHWKPDGAMIRRDWTEKLNYRAYRDQVFNQWWTDETDVTADSGAVGVRGFQGDYEIEVRWGGTTQKTSVRLGAEDKIVEVRLQ